MERFSNINTLLAFITVAREGSVSQAAEVLNLSQPAISHQIKRLSEDAGVLLFSRTAKGLRLTPDGSALLAKAERVLDALDDFRRSAEQRTNQISGKLRLGTIVDPEFIRLGQLLIQVRENFPNIETELKHGVSGEIITRLQRNQIDAGYYLSGPKPGQDEVTESETDLHFMKLADFSYHVIAPSGWQGRLEGKSWPDLAELPWIGTPDASVHRRLLSGIFEEAGCHQNIVALVDQEASMLEMVRAGVGLSLCRESIALHQQQAFGIAVSDTVSVPASLSFVTMDAHKKLPAIDAVITLLRDIWQLESA